ncbi:DUF2850 domain-containing protein [Vibrio profundum]|uniref:DUF2850 domain-containing protein n=1 Tax=Vibrio profundum TaxID=2910247 RepID=UPI003D0EF74D
MKLPFDQIYSRKTGKINQKAFKTFVMVALALLALELTYIAYSILNPPLNREDIYGTWIEIGGPAEQTELLTIRSTGVYKNNHLVTTQFQLDGNKVTVKTGYGRTVYEVIQDEGIPRLKKIEPRLPKEQWVKKGYEKMIDSTGGAFMRQEELSYYFKHRNAKDAVDLKNQPLAPAKKAPSNSQ